MWESNHGVLERERERNQYLVLFANQESVVWGVGQSPLGPKAQKVIGPWGMTWAWPMY